MKTTLFILVIGLLTSRVLGDTVVFKSGERLSGKVISVADSKMVFKSKVVGTVTFSLAEVEACFTEGKVEIVLKDGSVVEKPVQFQPGSATGAVDVVTSDGRVFDLEAVEKVNPEKKKWKGQIVANYLENRGNLQSRSLNVTGEAVRRGVDTRLSLNAGYLYGQQDDTKTGVETTTSDNNYAGGKFDYFFLRSLYAYVNSKYYRDSVLFLDYRFTEGLGLGFQWVDTRVWNFDTELGLNYVREKYWDPEEDEDYMGSRLAYHFTYTFWETFSAFHNLELVYSSSSVIRYLLSTDAGIQAKIAASWFAQAKVQILYDSAPPGDHEKFDSRYMLGLGYNF